jgi:hypothetical protein
VRRLVLSGSARGDGLREAHLDKTPPDREIAIAFWQRPDGVNVIRQHHHRVDLEGKASACLPYGLAQSLNVVDQEALPAIEKIHSEEPRGSCIECAAVVGHRVNR